MRDFRFAMRAMLAEPKLSAIMVLTLALGLGSTTALFALLDAVWIRSVPYAGAARIVTVFNRNPQFSHMAASWTDLEGWRTQTQLFEELAAFDRGAARVKVDGRLQPVQVVSVQPSLFGVLNETAAQGRTLVDADAKATPRPVMVSYDFWQRHFRSNSEVVNHFVDVEGDAPRLVVGVAPARLSRVIPADMVEVLAEPVEGRSNRTLTVIARLRNGVPLRTARGMMSELGRRAASASPQDNGHWDVDVETMRDRLVGADVSRTLFTLTITAWVVLFIACLNVASLLLSRVSERVPEFKVRIALGATPWKLLRQLLIESLILCLSGALLSGVVLYALRDVLLAAMPPNVPRLDAVNLNGRTFAFALGAAALTTILVTCLPAARLLRRRTRLNAEFGLGTPSMAHGTIVSIQVALSLAMIVLSVILLQSFSRLLAVNPGFDVSGLLAFQISTDNRTAAETVESIANELSRLPEVAAVGAIDHPPFGGVRSVFRVALQGDSERREIEVRRVSPGYFAAMRIPVRRGRAIESTDGSLAAPVAVVNERAARTLWPEQEAIGKRVTVGRTSVEVVGVVGDVRAVALDHDAEPELFRPLAQQPTGVLTVVVRAASARSVAVLSWLADPNHTLGGIKVETAGSFQKRIAQSVQTPRLRAVVFVFVASSVLVLTLVGVAGLTAQSVSRRSREIGLRMALGASAAQVVRLVTRQALAATLTGVVLGSALAWAASASLAGTLFETDTHELSAFAVGIGVLIAGALVTSASAARRATRIQPAAALRGL